MKRTYVEVVSKKKYPNNDVVYFDVDANEEYVKVIYSNVLNNKSAWSKPGTTALTVKSDGDGLLVTNNFLGKKIAYLDYSEASELYLALKEYHKIQKYGEYKLYRKKKNGRK